MKTKSFQSNTPKPEKKLETPFILGTIAASIFFVSSSCVDKGTTAAYDHGPFDANGNYIEEWADNPKYSRSRNNPPVLSDLDSGMVAANETPLPRGIPTNSSTSSTSKPKPSTTVRTGTTTKPKTTATRPTTKPKVAVTKPKPKTPSSTRVVVKKGDTLYELALRHKTSVSAIQKANGLRSTVLQIGKSLVIPK